MADQVSEPATGSEQAFVLEDSLQDQERMQELEERIREQGGFGPEGPETRGGLGSAQSMIAEAARHLGYRETGENDTTFNRWLGPIGGYPRDGYGYPWCHAFVSYCLWHSDNAGAGPRTAGCESGVSWFEQNGRFSSTAQVGDLVYYGPHGGTHVELVIGVSSDSIRTIGGNTSGSIDGSTFFNGDGVYQKTVSRTSRIYGYGHPSYRSGAGTPGSGGGTTSTAVEPMTAIRSIRQQQKAVNALGYTPKLDVDGEWGPNTEAGVKWLQKKIGAAVDGQWGAETESLFVAFAN